MRPESSDPGNAELCRGDVLPFSDSLDAVDDRHIVLEVLAKVSVSDAQISETLQTNLLLETGEVTAHIGRYTKHQVDKSRATQREKIQAR